MTDRPVFLPEFGAFLVKLRTAAGREWSQAKAADIATARKLAIGYQALRWLEEGKIKNPEPDLIRAVAALYEYPYDAMVAMVVRERYGLAIGSDARLDDGAQAPTLTTLADRITGLEDRLATRDAALHQVRDVALTLLHLSDSHFRGIAPVVELWPQLNEQAQAMTIQTMESFQRKQPNADGAPAAVTTARTAPRRRSSSSGRRGPSSGRGGASA